MSPIMSESMRVFLPTAADSDGREIADRPADIRRAPPAGIGGVGPPCHNCYARLVGPRIDRGLNGARTRVLDRGASSILAAVIDSIDFAAHLAIAAPTALATSA